MPLLTIDSTIVHKIVSNKMGIVEDGVQIERGYRIEWKRAPVRSSDASTTARVGEATARTVCTMGARSDHVMRAAVGHEEGVSRARGELLVATLHA